MKSLESIRSRFPELARSIYLNTASEGATPAEAIREAERIARMKASPWEIGAELYYSVPAAVRARLEKLLNAPPGSVALVAGTSAGIGLAATRLPLAPGDEVVLLEAQFPSNNYPWRAAQNRGATVRVVKRPFGTDPTETLLAALSPQTRAVSVDWVSFVDGAVVDLAAVGSVCRERRIHFIVDAAQGAGALTIDVEKTPIDLLAAPSHKWLLGPTGLGFVHVSPPLVPVLQSWNSGWLNLSARSGFRNLLRLDGEPPPDATRFETGTPAYSLLGPWSVSLDLLAEAGGNLVERQVKDLAARVVRGILDLSSTSSKGRGLTLVSPPPPAARSGIVAFHAGERTAQLYRTLESQNIRVALREGAIRVSAHVYNTKAEVDALLDGCAEFVR